MAREFSMTPCQQPRPFVPQGDNWKDHYFQPPTILTSYPLTLFSYPALSLRPRRPTVERQTIAAGMKTVRDSFSPIPRILELFKTYILQCRNEFILKKRWLQYFGESPSCSTTGIPRKNKSGLTLDELESVARESGLDPTLPPTSGIRNRF